ncbi:MAG: hypothetical protein HKN85_12920, partial [Gammaproteobacteria bacterium]|nr:hypothetical protein [Gammaproteobacteria bacterium]
MKAIIQKIVNVIKAYMVEINKLLGALESVARALLKFCFGFLAPLKQLGRPIKNLARHTGRILLTVIGLLIPIVLVTLLVAKLYQHGDRDPDRGAIAITAESMGESYSVPVYVDQGWSTAESLWFYNTTQGSNLLPYDFFLELEQVASQEKFISPDNIDRMRYLPQKPTLFNPDGLPVGFVKDTYLDKDYVGFTCAACHTGQVNYNGQAVRIDGGPAMADMDMFLLELQRAMEATVRDPDKNRRFVDNVLARDGLTRGVIGGDGYSEAEQVKSDLVTWTDRIAIYNTVNHSDVAYGFARLDAFGRIYNRVLQHVLEVGQIKRKVEWLNRTGSNEPLFTPAQITNIFKEIGAEELVISQEQFEQIVKNLAKAKPEYPGLDTADIREVINRIFNPADAPVSYPFLWDIAQSDYVQWNGLAANAGIGPLGRNTGEVIGVFGTLDWKKAEQKWYDVFGWLKKINLSAVISGQSGKSETMDFQSSIDKVNLTRLESHLRELQSPLWEDVEFLPPVIDKQSATFKRGRQLYAQYCQSCHELIVRDDWNRLVTASMLSVDKAGTDPKMADNGVGYTGSSGNFVSIYQDTDAGPVVVREEAPVVQILTAATRGVIATPDADKWMVRRVADWFYSLFASIRENNIKPSVKSGNYNPDSTVNPYASLWAYKARSLNGIWATAPYLHNGSVPTLYDLLLPKKRSGDPENGNYRPDTFKVGCRELDVVKVGFVCQQGHG